MYRLAGDRLPEGAAAGCRLRDTALLASDTGATSGSGPTIVGVGFFGTESPPSALLHLADVLIVCNATACWHEEHAANGTVERVPAGI